MAKSDVLVLGGSGAGKTHFAGQLLGRLRNHREGRLRVRPGGVEDLSKLEEILACLEAGRAAGHTSAETWTGVRCELEAGAGTRVVLEWPEYAGERLFSIVERRSVPSEWRVSIREARGWLLFIRPSTLKIYEDLVSRPTGIAPEHPEAEGSIVGGSGWDAQARFVELLQMLLLVAGHTSFRRGRTPRLVIALSCWDELTEAKTTPEDLLRQRLPLVDAFVRSTWDADVWSVWGLSSLGRALKHDVPDQEFAELGPEHFGYVRPPGTREENPDLTLPVAWLLGL